MPASEARGRNSFPGSTTESSSVHGIRSSDTTRVVGWPMTRAGLMPMLMPAEFLNFRLTRSLVASAIGLSPSIKSDVMRGMSSITAPILMPRPRMYGMRSTTSPQLRQLRQPMRMPTSTPSRSGSPSTPNFFFMPSASMSSLLKPGMRSMHQFRPSAKGTKPWQKG